MEAITLSGILADDCEKKTDKKGHQYIRFKVSCEGTDIYGKPRITQYRCYLYNMQFDNLKKGELVFLTGSFNLNQFNGRINCDIYVQQIARGCYDKK